MKVTIRKIADIAGVSRGTVDRVLNGRIGVKMEVRERVLDIASKLDYSPNIVAKALAHNKKPIIIGIIMPPSNITFFDEICRGIRTAEEELKDFGIRLEYRYVSNQEPSEASFAINELVMAGVSGIMFSVMDDPEIRTQINVAVDKGVPVVTFNSDVTSSKRICFVGQDLYKSGRLAAGLMSRVLSKGSNIVVVTGNLMFQAHKARVDGFIHRISELGFGLKVIEVIESYDRYEDTYRKLSSVLSRFDNLKGIYMATGHVGACVDVVKEHGLKHDVNIVCNDLLPEVVDNIKTGIIDFTIVQNPFVQRYKSLKVL